MKTVEIRVPDECMIRSNERIRVVEDVVVEVSVDPVLRTISIPHTKRPRAIMRKLKVVLFNPRKDFGYILDFYPRYRDRKQKKVA